MKFLKYFFYFIAACIVLLFVTCSVISKKLPTGVASPETEEIIQKMWTSLNKEAWDNTRYVRWSFAGMHHYVWDKKANLAEIKWKKNRVLLDPDAVDGIAYSDGERLEGDKARKLIDKAWSYWCNDMFWLIAPFKVKDKGTKQELIDHPEGKRLKVSYLSGGVTPGDSYVWIFNEDGSPKAFELYVGILPVKGMRVPWEKWETISTGAKLCSEHKMAGIGLKLTNILGGNNLGDVNLNNYIWEDLRKVD